MVKKIIYNTIVIIVLVMISLAILRANKPRADVLKTSLNNTGEKKSNLTPKEAKYYRVIEE